MIDEQENYNFIINHVKEINNIREEFRISRIFSKISRIPMYSTRLILKRAAKNGDIRLYKNLNGEDCVEYIKEDKQNV